MPKSLPLLTLATTLLFAGCASTLRPRPHSTAELCRQLPVLKPPCTTGVVETSNAPDGPRNPVCGLHVETDAKPVRAFLGIPYAAPTCGPNRWQHAKAVKPWSETLVATRFGPSCPQNTGISFHTEQSEDCLSINVWTPVPEKSTEKRPVMMFIYGGGFSIGASSGPLYQSDYLAAHGDVVVVNFNYRVGALGFLTGIDGLEANFGFGDQIKALEWVQGHIEAFGGDPDNVTIFGESAGAASVSLHLSSSPSSEPLFKAGLMESPYYGIPYRTQRQAETVGKAFRRHLGCEGEKADCMRNATFAEIVKAESSLAEELPVIWQGRRALMPWAPVIDGKLIVNQPNDKKLTKPTLLGTNLDEAALFVYGAFPKEDQHLKKGLYELSLTVLFGLEKTRKILEHPPYRPIHGDNRPALQEVMTDGIFTCPARAVAMNAEASIRDKVFTYQFAQHTRNFNIWPQVPECKEMVCHSAELPYVFHSARAIHEELTPGEGVLSRAMVDYWSTFATTNEPSRDVLGAPPLWPPVPEVLVLKVEEEKEGSGVRYVIPPAQDDPFKEKCAFWDELDQLRDWIPLADR